MIDVHLPTTDGREIILTCTTKSEPEPYLNTYFFQVIEFSGNLAKFGATWHYTSENRIFALCIGVCAAFTTRFDW